MPMKNITKNSRCSWSVDKITAAINAVQPNSMEIRKTLRTYNVPHGTGQSRFGSNR